MGWLTWVAIYFTTWWVVLFAILPIGAQPPEQVEQGHATSAPARPDIKKKFLLTTVISAALVFLGWSIFATGLLDWQAIMRPERA
ncbi:MAG: hypothetical protein RLY86_2269 [Pseudomonadota bacterium]|jgi:predicted secreted protein